MLKKLFSFTLIFIMIAYMAIPAYADDSFSWVKYSVNDKSEVTIEWNSFWQVKELLIKRNCDGSAFEEFKRFKSNVPNNGSFSFTETGVGFYSYTVELYGESVWGSFLIASSEENYSVKGTGETKIRLEFINPYSQEEKNSSVERIKNWVNIYNLGSTNVDIKDMRIKYFYTIDGEPGIVDSTNNINDGQERIEQSDAKLNPFPQFAEYTLGNKDVQNENIAKMNFYRMPWDVYDDENEKVADYYCETYFETSAVIDSAYYLMFQPAFHKKQLTTDETNLNKDTYIRNYKVLNDYSYDNSDNIAVYIGDELVWGNDPSVLQAPKNLQAKKFNFKDVKLTWEASKYANGYNVWRCEGDGGTFKKINEQPITGTDFIDYNTRIAKNSLVYYYKVTATYTDENNVKICESKDSNIVSVNMPILAAPIGLEASYDSDANEVTLTWTASMGALSYEIYRSEAADGTRFDCINRDKLVTTNSFIDGDISSEMDGKNYYYKVVAIYDGEPSNDSDIVAVPIDMKFVSCVCEVLSTKKQRNGFALGTYIPVSLEITVKRDISNLRIILHNDLTTTPDFTNNLNAVLVSEVNGTATRLFKTKWRSSVYNNSSDLSKVSISPNNIIIINEKFQNGDVVYVELALKTSAGQNVLSYGIQNYYGKLYNLNFILQGNGSNFFGNANTSVIITKPNLK